MSIDKRLARLERQAPAPDVCACGTIDVVDADNASLDVCPRCGKRRVVIQLLWGSDGEGLSEDGSEDA